MAVLAAATMAGCGPTTDRGNTTGSDCRTAGCPAGKTCKASGSTYSCQTAAACTATSCGTGFTCNPTTKVCEAVPAGGLVGDACTTPGEQGNCETGAECSGITPTSLMCTKECTGNADCGTNGATPNVCVKGATAAKGFCIRGCSATDACGRTDFICMPTQSLGSVCYPDCRSDSTVCQYGETCGTTGQEAGFCTSTPCQTAAPQCPAGQVCYTATPQDKVCVADCTVAGNTCPAGMECDTPNKTCKGTAGGAYNDCTASQTCGDNADCIGLQGGPAKQACLPTCTGQGDTSCATGAAGAQCAVSDGAATPQYWCIIPCSGASATNCPTGTTCQKVGKTSSGADAFACWP